MRSLLITLWLVATTLHAGPFPMQADSARRAPGAVGWWQAGDNLLNGGVTVSTLWDRTGLGHVLTNATAANQPLISRADNAGNLLVRSQEFETTWGISALNAFGATDTGASGAGSFANTARTSDPVGGNNADFLQENGVNTFHFIQQAGTYAPGVRYTTSIFVKDGGRFRFSIYLISGPFGVEQSVMFNLTAVTATPLGGTPTGSITPVGNGWYLCTISATATVGGVSNIQIRLADNGGTTSYAGDNTSGLFLYGASLRPANWDATYIITTATPIYAGWNGYYNLYFDGTDDFLKTATFTLVQPSSLTGVFNQWTATAGDRFFDGFGTDGGAVRQGNVNGLLTLVASASAANNNTDFPLATNGVVLAMFSGANSLLGINNKAATTGDPGANSMNGLTLAARGNNTVNANISFAEGMLFSSTNQNRGAYLSRVWNRKYNLGY